MKNFAKFFGMFSLALCAVLFTGCSSDDDGDGGTLPPTGKKTPGVEYGLHLNDDMLNLADVVVAYWDAEGQLVKDTLTEADWEKTFTLTKSQQIGMSVTVVAKDNLDELLAADPEKKSYRLGYQRAYATYYIDENGKKVNSSGILVPTGSLLTVAKDKVAKYLADTSHNKTVSASYDKDTNTFTSWE